MKKAVVKKTVAKKTAVKRSAAKKKSTNLVVLPGDALVELDANQRRVLSQLCGFAVNDSHIGTICQIVIAGLAQNPADAEITFQQDAQLAGGLFGYVHLLAATDQPVAKDILQTLFRVAFHRKRGNGNKVIITQT